MTGDLRSSILTTAAVAVSVAGLTVIQPLTAAPPLLLAALLMDGDTADYTGLADTISGKLLPADGKAVVLNFLTGPFGIWNALEDQVNPEDVVPSTTLGVASSLPFMTPPLPAGVVPPALAPAVVGPPLVPATVPAPLPVVPVDVPSLDTGDPMLVKPPTEPTVPTIRPVVTSFEYDLGSYATATLINPFAWTNAVAAYLERTLTGAVVPVNPDGSVGCDDGASECDVAGGVISQFTDENGVKHITFTTDNGTVVEATVETRDGVTYVTYENDGSLPLVRPLRDYGGLLGNELADVLEPALTALVYWGYRDAAGESTDQFLPTVAETIRAVLDFIVGVKVGLESLLEPHDAASSTTSSSAAASDAVSDTAVSDTTSDTTASDTTASAVPTDDVPDELAAPEATTPEVTTPETVEQPAAPTPEPETTPTPLKPVPLSIEDAVNKLTNLFQKHPAPEAEDADDTSPDDTSSDDTDSDGDAGDDGVTAPDKTVGDKTKDSDADKPDRVRGGPNKAPADSGTGAKDKDSAAKDSGTKDSAAE